MQTLRSMDRQRTRRGSRIADGEQGGIITEPMAALKSRAAQNKIRA